MPANILPLGLQKLEWRPIKSPFFCSLVGLEQTIHGKAVATNGILVAIEMPHRLFIGHLDNVVKDKKEATHPKDALSRKSARAGQTVREFVI